jgi:multiple sugar transport system permease protein/raffinose/stachyose/melibiose transport system permease protein
MTRHLWAWRIAFLALPLALYAVVVIWPLADSFYYSFTDWRGFDPDYSYVGLDNFVWVLTDPLFGNAVINTLIWTLAALLLPTIAGLMLALLLSGGLIGARIFKSIFYLPICLSTVVVGQIWIWIYQPQWGLLNTTLIEAGLRSLRTAWLSDPDTSLYSVIAAWSWQQTGLSMVIFLAGLTTIPDDVNEAAAIDGATGLRRTWHITLPLLRPATVVAVALAVINSLKGFDIVYIMTGGGPFNASDTLAMLMYTESFAKYLMGHGSAIAVILFLITLVIIAIYFRQVGREVR